MAFFVPMGKLVCHRVCHPLLFLVVRNYNLLRALRRQARASPRRLASLSQLQTALDEAAPKGFANGAFEELEEDVLAGGGVLLDSHPAAPGPGGTQDQQVT